MTVTGTLTNPDATKLVIEDGGQLICNNNVTGTVKKTINAATNWGNSSYTPDGWYFIASPMTSILVDDTDQTNLTGASDNDYDLYQFNQASTNAEWQNYKPMTGSSHTNFATLNNGQGYLYASEKGIELTFTGEMVSTSPTITLKNEGASYPLAGYNLIGNPFPCQVTLSDATMPFYRMQNGSYVPTTPVAAGSTINPLEGVLVHVDANQDITFTKVTPNNAAAPSNPSVNISLNKNDRNAQVVDNALVSFKESSRLPKFYFGESNANIYIPQDDKEFAIVSAGTQGEMPVNFVAHEDGQYTLTINPEDVEMNYLHLIDNLTGADVDLLTNPSYTFNASTTDFASRFRLVFSANGVNDINAENDHFAFIGSDGQLIVNGKGTLQVFDVLGRQILTKELSTLNSQLSILNSAGVYVLRLTNGNETKTQKIIVK